MFIAFNLEIHMDFVEMIIVLPIEFLFELNVWLST
jgi:hypothetical protein